MRLENKMQIVSKKTLKELENIIIRNNKAPNNTNVLANLTYKCVDDLKNYCLQNSDLHYRFLTNVLLTDFEKTGKKNTRVCNSEPNKRKPCVRYTPGNNIKVFSYHAKLQGV